MKRSLIFLALLCFVCAEKYSNKYDNVDLEPILRNDRVLTNYIRCVMDEGSCTNEGRELKKTLPDALKSACSKCTEKQKETADRVINHLRTKRPKDWDRLTAKYDPQGEYKKRYEATIATKKV